MPTINGKACVVDGNPVDKVFSNGKQVYGRNMISGSHDSSYIYGINRNAKIEKITMNSGAVALHVVSTDKFAGFFITFYLPSGNYTVSFDVVGKGALSMLGWQGISNDGIALTSNWQRVSRTGSLDGERHSFVFYGVMDAFVRFLKVEQGTIATPWTPAPEDVM